MPERRAPEAWSKRVCNALGRSGFRPETESQDVVCILQQESSCGVKLLFLD